MKIDLTDIFMTSLLILIFIVYLVYNYSPSKQNIRSITPPPTISLTKTITVTEPEHTPNVVNYSTCTIALLNGEYIKTSNVTYTVSGRELKIYAQNPGTYVIVTNKRIIYDKIQNYNLTVKKNWTVILIINPGCIEKEYSYQNKTYIIPPYGKLRIPIAQKTIKNITFNITVPTYRTPLIIVQEVVTKNSAIFYVNRNGLYIISGIKKIEENVTNNTLIVPFSITNNGTVSITYGNISKMVYIIGWKQALSNISKRINKGVRLLNFTEVTDSVQGIKLEFTGSGNITIRVHSAYYNETYTFEINGTTKITIPYKLYSIGGFDIVRLKISGLGLKKDITIFVLLIKPYIKITETSNAIKFELSETLYDVKFINVTIYGFGGFSKTYTYKFSAPIELSSFSVPLPNAGNRGFVVTYKIELATNETLNGYKVFV